MRKFERKMKKDRSRKIRERKRQLRENYMFRKTNYKETVDYALDCFFEYYNS